MSAPVRIVVLGNSFASHVQLPALRWAGFNEVVGIAGADAGKAARTAAEWGIPVGTGDWRELLALEPDLVVITTPVHLHAEMVRAALETPAAILCEKPFTLDAAEALPLAEAARGRLAVIDHQLRWSPWRRRLREIVRSGELGEVWSARYELRFGGARRVSAPYSWWYDAARGGGTLGAIVSHQVDILRRDLGEVDAVRARLATYVPERTDAEGRVHRVTADEHARLWLRTASGVEVTVEANLMAPGSTGSLVEIVGSEGTLRLEEETQLVLARHGAEPEEVDVVPPPTLGELGMPDVGVFARMLPLYLREVVAAVAAGATEIPDAASFADAVATMRVLDAARRSAVSEIWEAAAP